METLGWDIHGKLSKVSLVEKTAEGESRVIERARLERAEARKSEGAHYGYYPNYDINGSSGYQLLTFRTHNRKSHIN